MSILKAMNEGIESKYFKADAEEDKAKFERYAGKETATLFESLKGEKKIKGSKSDYYYWMGNHSADELKAYVESLDRDPLRESKEDQTAFEKFAGKTLANRFEKLKASGKIKSHTRGDYTYWMSRSPEELRDFLDDVESKGKYVDLDESKEDQTRFERLMGKTLANRFEKLKASGKIKSHTRGDYTYWMSRSPEELRDFLDDVESKGKYVDLDESTADRSNAKAEGSAKVYSSNGWNIYKIYTYDAARLYGAGTKWAIASPKTEIGERYFKLYKEHGVKDFYFIINSSDNKWCYLDYGGTRDNVLYDAADKCCSTEEVCNGACSAIPEDVIKALPGMENCSYAGNVSESYGNRRSTQAINEAFEDAGVQDLIEAAREATDAAAEEVMNELDSDDDNILMAAQELLFYASITVALVDHANEDCIIELASGDGITTISKLYDAWGNSNDADVTDNINAWEFIQEYCDNNLFESKTTKRIGRPLAEDLDDTSVASVKANVQAEYDRFVSDWESGKGWKDAGGAQKYTTMTALYNAIEDDMISEDCYDALAEEGASLSPLYDEYLEKEEEVIDTPEQAADFIERYCERFHGTIGTIDHI